MKTMQHSAPPADPIVQCIREIGPGGGVSGVAYALETALRKRGVPVRSFTLADVGIRRSARKSRFLLVKKLVHLFDVLWFSTAGTLVARLSLRKRRVICHNDAVYGQVYVNHGLHRAMLDASGRKWRMLLRNPLHCFLWMREGLRFALDAHDRYVCFSASERDLMSRYFPGIASKIRIIPNGVDTQMFRPDSLARSQLRAELGIPPEAFVLAFVGHEYERKGLTPAIEALRMLEPDVHLIVAGGTREEIARGMAVAAKAGVTERLRFLGPVPTAQRVLNAGDCLVLPSAFEAWPLVGLEAMACGIPALMTAVGGIPDYLVDGLNGYLITRDPADIAAKARAIRAGERAAMSRRCVEFAAGYSWDAIASRYLELFAELETPRSALGIKRPEIA